MLFQGELAFAVSKGDTAEKRITSATAARAALNAVDFTLLEQDTGATAQQLEEYMYKRFLKPSRQAIRTSMLLSCRRRL